MPSIDHDADLSALLAQDAVTIPVSGGETTIDTDDILNVYQAGPWRMNSTRGYVVRDAWDFEKHRRVTQALHTFLTGWDYVDHANGNTADNRRSNLRNATASKNMGNTKMPSNNTSGFKGVTTVRSGRWAANITCEGKTHYLGTFDTPEEAGRAYDDAAVYYFGEYAALNFPRDGYRCIRDAA